MDTKSKKSRKLKAFLCRIIAAGMLFATLALGLLGREALINLYKEGTVTLSGSPYALTEFREYVAYLYTQGMLGYAGIGDNNGAPLQDDRFMLLAEEAKVDFLSEARYAGDNLLYYIEYDGQVLENNISYPIFSEQDDHLFLPEHVKLCCYWNGETEHLLFFSTQYRGNWQSPFLKDYYEQPYKAVTEETGKIKLVIALEETKPYSSAHSSYLPLLSNQAIRYRNILITLFVFAGITVIAWFCCLFTVKAGKQAKSAYQQAAAKLFVELRLLIICAVFYLCHTMRMWDFAGSFNHRAGVGRNCGLYILAGITFYLFYLDLRGNGMELPKQTIAYKLYLHFRRYQASLPWHRKALNMYYPVLASSVFLLSAGAVMLLLTLGIHSENYYINFQLKRTLLISVNWLAAGMLTFGIMLLLISRRLKHFIADTASISNKLADIKAGKDSLPLQLSTNSLLSSAAEHLNDVDSGIQTAVEQQNRSNKMRVELITNVSHDLKTPLTSIINYADLLCDEGLPAPASEYADALRTKAYRLKSMVQDVFDLSKATSGNMRVEKTRLDLAKLVRQTLADMDERIQESSLIFKLNITSEPLYIEADGEKLYRVFQNLIINALQYSLENSRVYILLEEKGETACAMLKNISRQEIDFTADEIMERFVRADSSRTTEGSGLGLSIVRSFTEACGGTFTIEMNADLFTACVVFPLAKASSEAASAEDI